MILRALALFCSVTLLAGCAAPLVVAGGAAATGVVVAKDRRTAGTMLDDERIEMKSQQAIADDQELMENTYVNITSYNGVVLITGEANLAAYKQRVEKLVRQQTKVRFVRNELQVGPLSDSASRRNDSLITARLKSGLIRADNVDSSNIKVVSESATVYLMGLVTPEEADQVVAVARKTEGVARIVKVFEYNK